MKIVPTGKDGFHPVPDPPRDVQTTLITDDVKIAPTGKDGFHPVPDRPCDVQTTLITDDVKIAPTGKDGFHPVVMDTGCPDAGQGLPAMRTEN